MSAPFFHRIRSRRSAPAEPVCAVCGYPAERDEPGHACPECGASPPEVKAGLRLADMPPAQRGLVRASLLLAGGLVFFVAALTPFRILFMRGATERFAGALVFAAICAAPVALWVASYLLERRDRPQGRVHHGTTRGRQTRQFCAAAAVLPGITVIADTIVRGFASGRPPVGITRWMGFPMMTGIICLLIASWRLLRDARSMAAPPEQAEGEEREERATAFRRHRRGRRLRLAGLAAIVGGCIAANLLAILLRHHRMETFFDYAVICVALVSPIVLPILSAADAVRRLP